MVKKNDKALNMLLPAKLYADAKAAAEHKNISLAALVRMALTEWLGNERGRLEIEDKSIDEIFDMLEGNIVKDGELYAG
jgi:hypothetical protein